MNQGEVAFPLNEHLIDMGVNGRVALVTGGARNIGRQTALALARCGVKVGIIARTDSELLASAVEECNASAPSFGVAADLSDPASMEAAVAAIEEALGPIDILVNNAAIRPRVPIADITLDGWADVLDTNVRGPFLLIQRVLSGMLERRWGRIINVSGIDAINGSVDRVHVTTSKGALLGLTASLVPQVAKYGVTVNTIVPGAIDTERHTPEWYPEKDTFYAANVARFPIGRFGTPDEVANVIMFMSSGLASYMTGQTIVVAGGWPFDRRKESEVEPDLDWVGDNGGSATGAS
jgi:3-oxoacyl-[acyl-carrier protein] reductase